MNPIDANMLAAQRQNPWTCITPNEAYLSKIALPVVGEIGGINESTGRQDSGILRSTRTRGSLSASILVRVERAR